MNSPSKDVASLIAAGGLSLTLGTTLFVVREPTTPHNTVTVFDGANSPPMLTMTKGENYFYDAVQIRVRNTDSQAGYSVASSIVTLLHGQGQVTVNGTLYSVIYCSSGPVPLGYDDNGRMLYVINFEIQRR